MRAEQDQSRKKTKYNFLPFRRLFRTAQNIDERRRQLLFRFFRRRRWQSSFKRTAQTEFRHFRLFWVWRWVSSFGFWQFWSGWWDRFRVRPDSRNWRFRIDFCFWIVFGRIVAWGCWSLKLYIPINWINSLSRTCYLKTLKTNF